MPEPIRCTPVARRTFGSRRENRKKLAEVNESLGRRGRGQLRSTVPVFSNQDIGVVIERAWLRAWVDGIAAARMMDLQAISAAAKSSARGRFDGGPAF
jgi:hypothetical protein